MHIIKPPGSLSDPNNEVFALLEEISQGRPSLTTEEAAHVLNRKPQTLRKWAAFENGPIRPIRINGRLGWLVPQIKVLLNGGACVDSDGA